MSTTVYYLNDAFKTDSSMRLSYIGNSASYNRMAVITGEDNGYWEFPRMRSVYAYQFGSQSMATVSLPMCAEIGSYAFYRCNNLRVLYASSCTSIGDNALYNCTTLSSAYLPACRTVGNYAFGNCSTLSSLSLPAVADMGYGAFNGCTNLLSLNLSGITSVPTLSSNVFSNTPIVGFSAYTQSYGSVYVPSSLYSDFLSANYWSAISDRIVSL